MRVTLLTAVVLTACPAAKQASALDANDPLLRKLQAEKTRVTPPAALVQSEALANAAVSDAPPVVLPALAAGPVGLNDARFTIKSLERSRTVKGDGVSVSTTDSFLKVTLTAFAAHEQPFDFSTTTLGSFGIDAAAQRVGHGSPMHATLRAEPQDITLFFEVPDTEIKPGLTLTVRAPDVSAELALQ